MSTTRIFGPPGTGKTTQLLKIVEDAMASGMKPERIAFVSFTVKASDVSIRRAQEKFKMPEERFPHFRTLHSMAFRHLHARKDDMMDKKNFQELGRMLGFEFTGAEDSEISSLPAGTALGDKVEKICSLARTRMITLEQSYDDCNLRDVPWLAVKQWDEGVKLYKQSRGMMDFTDLLEQCDATLDVDLFIVDEAQDLSPLQWKVVEAARASARTTYVAGDDDQCIYGWAGADVRKFLELPASDVVLPKSFRLPRAIHRLALDIVSQIDVRKDKVFQSRDEEGAVNRIGSERSLDLSKGSWLLLTRNKCFLRRFREVCENQGYAYRIGSYHSTDNAQTKAIQHWENWRKGHPLKPAEFKAMKQFCPFLDEAHPRGDCTWKDVRLPNYNILKKTWMDVLDIRPRQREYYRACLANKESFTAEPRITISTIHQAKGGEADHVVLIPDLTPNPYDELHTDDEKRVQYVAVTRARQTLTIVQPQSARHYRI